ncbi:carbohydrate sulfotransferase 3 [Arctopsyche grandis]|uniref:carbohydrate sulfotransferase 3 n=1 Tax=Arctopsyche grandis TaxID=121162 RepID=UPI00406D67C9
MSRRLNVYGLCLVFGGSLLLLASQQLANPRPHPHPHPQQPQSAAPPRPTAPTPPPASSLSHNRSQLSIEEVISLQRARIQHEMRDYRFEAGSRGLEGLTPETGGTPRRSLILTTWRSGSTFVGDILNALPANYYHYEPLLNFDIVQIRGPPHAAPALRNLRQLLDCDYHGPGMEEYLHYGRAHVWLFTHNERLWEHCSDHPHLCWNATFLTKFCRLFPFQSMKVVRLRLKLAEELLGDDSEGPRILLLVRDPRGVLQSRRHRDWCPGQPDCDQPALLCADMVSDYVAAVRMAALHPRRFRVLRYEDLSLDPYKTVSSLLDFFGVDFHSSVKEFLDTHTKLDLGGVSSTFRNSKSAPFHWTKDLDFEDVWNIQSECFEAMAHWGYNMAHNQSHLMSKEFNPLGEYSVA